MAGRRRQRRVRRRRGGRRLRIPLNGGMVRGKMHPPTTSASPWNSYTLTTIWKANAADTGNQCLLASTAEAAIKKELGLADSIDMRITRVDVWTPPAFQNNDSNCIVFSPIDWTNHSGCGVSQLAWFEAWGTSVQPAHVHYVWPRSISNIVIPSGSKFPICSFNIIAGQEFILKIHLVWRAHTPAPRAIGGTLISTRERQEGPDSPDHEFEDLAAISQLAV